MGGGKAVGARRGVAARAKAVVRGVPLAAVGLFPDRVSAPGGEVGRAGKSAGDGIKGIPGNAGR